MSSNPARNLTFWNVLIGVTLCCMPSHAQQQAQGFALERLYQSAPGGGWFVMDALDMHGDFGGAVEITTGYANDPLRVQAAGQSLAVVSSEAILDFGLAGTYHRFRAYANFTVPLRLSGYSGIVGGYAYTAPDVNLRSNPDDLSDIRPGFDARILGDAQSRFRLGTSAQLFVPNDMRANYTTDDRIRAMGRLLFAGDEGLFTYAGQAGVHFRPLNDAPIPGSPQGNEFLFGIAAGVKILVGAGRRLVVGPEIYGASSFRSFMQAADTDKEWLISTRLEGTGNHGRQTRVKLGVGGGINPQFGAPKWRMVLGVEFFGWTK